MIDLNALIRDAHEIEALPASVSRLATLVADEDSSTEEIIEVVRFDQALTARMLQVANSASSGARAPVTTVRAAVVRMGRGTLLSLAMASAVRKTMYEALPEYSLSEGELWYHSVAAAVVAEEMAAFCSQPIPPEVFTAALLHDVGKLILSRFLDPEASRVLTLAMHEGKLDRLNAEREVLTVHHGELGGLVSQKWELPEGIVKGITYHHTPEEGFDLVADATYLANRVAHVIEYPEGDDGYEIDLQPELLERLGIDAEGVQELCTVSVKRVDEVTSLYE